MINKILSLLNTPAAISRRQFIKGGATTTAAIALAPHVEAEPAAIKKEFVFDEFEYEDRPDGNYMRLSCPKTGFPFVQLEIESLSFTPIVRRIPPPPREAGNCFYSPWEVRVEGCEIEVVANVDNHIAYQKAISRPACVAEFCVGYAVFKTSPDRIDFDPIEYDGVLTLLEVKMQCDEMTIDGIDA